MECSNGTILRNCLLNTAYHDKHIIPTVLVQPFGSYNLFKHVLNIPLL